MTTIATAHRRLSAKLALSALKSAAPERRRQLLDNWLYVATKGEVRNNWQSHWGAMPKWAEK